MPSSHDTERHWKLFEMDFLLKNKIFWTNYQNCLKTFVNLIFYIFFLQGAQTWVRKIATALCISVGLKRCGIEKKMTFDSRNRCKKIILKLASMKLCKQFFSFFRGFFTYLDELMMPKRNLGVPQSKSGLSSVCYWVYWMVM